MKIKKGLIVLFFVHFAYAEHVAWEVTSIVNNSDLLLKNTEALYGENQNGQQIHEPITDYVRKNSSHQIIPVAHLHSSVGTNSQGFNTLSAQDNSGKEYTIRFDGQRAIRVDRGREKATVVTQGLGKNIATTPSIARVELVADIDGESEVLSSDVKSYTVENDSFSIVLSGKAGKYSVHLQK